MKKIVILGATGFLGRSLCRKLVNNYQLTVISRNASSARAILSSEIRIVECDYANLSSIAAEFEDVFAVINLAGDNIASSIWTSKKKRTMRSSRIDTTNVLVEVLASTLTKPKKLLQASAIGIYGDQGEDIVDENTEVGQGYLANLVFDWEASAAKASSFTDVIYLRMGIVVGAGGGALAKTIPLFKMFLGGHIGDGNQWMSYIHCDDFVAIAALLLQKRFQGAINLVSTKPLRSKEFFATLGKVLGRPSWLHIPKSILRLLPSNMGQDLFLASQRVVSNRLEKELRYSFQYNSLAEAIEMSI